MKIVYFYQYFTTPKGSWSTRVYDFAKNWVEEGHDVTVVTSIYAKSDLTSKKIIETQIIDGIKLKVINVKIDNRQPKWKRIWSFIQYLFLSSWYAIILKADVVIASSGPLTVGIAGLIAHYIRGRKMVFEVRDLWPENAILMGFLKGKNQQKLAYLIEKLCYKASSLIIVLSQGMKKNIEDRFGYEKILVIPNSANNELFGAINHNIDLPDIYSKSKIAIYAGNIGEINNSYFLFNAAKILKSNKNNEIKILLIGEGPQKEELKKKSEAEGIDNFIIYDLIPKETLVKYIQNAFVSVIPLKNNPLLDTSSPNKLFDSLAASTPVIQTTQGWIKELLIEKKCGLSINADNPTELVDAINHLLENKILYNEMKINARNVALKEFDKNYLAKVFIDNLIEL